eukprot:TRINITY_DN691_c4_g1_i1.p1 TRINITY_DN691_c4_g1~~TRINITY_DN691_c4_g1_i1.p1  ORF type:complete len:416 (-),score=146.50 TRINITY_DN691_c4_g1_i1:178-1425(-)
MSKRWRGITATSPSALSDCQARFQTRAGHICVLCGFIPTTKNKYRELQDHLVRVHFREAIKAALPTRRPYLCPEKNCSVEGKDWQALMRHYTGKHGVLDAYLKHALTETALSPSEETHHHLPVVETLEHGPGETLYIQDPNNIIHTEVDPMGQDPHSVEVVTSFEYPPMMTTTTLDTGTTITTTESVLQSAPCATHYVTHDICAEPTTQTIQIQNFEERLKDTSSSSSSSTSPGKVLEVSQPSEDLAPQVNTVSSTIPFPTTIPLMLGATATKRPKTEPDIVVNNGVTPENYELVDLKYFIADPSKVLSLPYKIILPQMEEEEEPPCKIHKSLESRTVQTEMTTLPPPRPITVSVQVQTDPWIPSPTATLQAANNNTHMSTQTPSIKTEILEASELAGDNNNNGRTIKELDFSMF